MPENLKKYFITAALSLLPSIAQAETCSDASNDFVNPERTQTADSVNRVYVDPVYATEGNFTGRPLDGYSAKKVWIHPDALEVLQEDTPALQGRLKTHLMKAGMDERQATQESARFFYLIKDAYRPFRATTDMNRWRTKVNSDSDPSNNVGSGWIAGTVSNHNRGYTVDRTLVRKMDDGTFREVWMGSHFDEFNSNSYLMSEGGSSHIVGGRGHSSLDDKFAYGGSYFVVPQLSTSDLRKILADAPGSDYWMEWWHTTIQSGGTCYDRPIQ